MSRIIENASRSNYHFESDYQINNRGHIQIYLFTKNKLSHIASSLKLLLEKKKYSYQIQEINSSLDEIVIKTNKKSIVLI